MAAHARHHVSKHRDRTSIVVMFILTISGAVLGLLSFAPLRPVLVWNFSPSVPQGLYALRHAQWRRADLVAVAPTGRTEDLLADYDILPTGRLLIKRVAATAGDIVCRRSQSVSINGRVVATARWTMQNGRPLPVWQSCTALSAGQVFLLADHPASFDGRYFGVSDAADILGPLRTVWSGCPLFGWAS